MVKIRPGQTTPTIDDTSAADDAAALERATAAKPAAGVQARDALETGATARRADTGATGKPSSEAGGGGLQDIADLVNHRSFGFPDPHVPPARGPDMEKMTPDPAALAVDVPGLLRDAQAQLDPSSAQAQAIRDLSAAFGGLEHLAPENYLPGNDMTGQA